MRVVKRKIDPYFFLLPNVTVFFSFLFFCKTLFSCFKLNNAKSFFKVFKMYIYLFYLALQAISERTALIVFPGAQYGLKGLQFYDLKSFIITKIKDMPLSLSLHTFFYFSQYLIEFSLSSRISQTIF